MSNKKIIILPFLIFLLTLSCENDVEIVAPGNGLPVIHFILDPFEDEYYATVTKIGIDSKGFAEFSDSTELFYPDGISLSLELWNDSIRLWYSDFRPVQKTKDPGLFPSETGFLYKSNNIIPKRESSYGFLEGYPHFSYFRIILNGDEFEKTAYSRVCFGEYPVNQQGQSQNNQEDHELIQQQGQKEQDSQDDPQDQDDIRKSFPVGHQYEGEKYKG